METRPQKPISKPKETKAQARFRGLQVEFCFFPGELKKLKGTTDFVKGLERSKIYLELGDNELTYTVKVSKTRETGGVTYEAVTEKITAKELGSEINPNQSLEELDQHKIFGIISKRGHTYEVKDGLDFFSWYSPEILQSLIYLLPPNQIHLKPYVFPDEDSISPEELMSSQLDLLRKRLADSKATVQTFIVKPESGHFYGGILFKHPDSKEISLILFNPIGKYGKIQNGIKELKNKKWFSKIYLTNNQIQTQEKDIKGLNSCGPISYGFVQHNYNSPLDWIKKLLSIKSNEDVIFIDLNEFDMLPKELQNVSDPNQYKETMITIRRNHYQSLAGIQTQDDFNKAFEIEMLGFNETKEEPKVSKKDKAEKDLLDQIDNDFWYSEEEEDFDSETSQKENEEGEEEDYKENQVEKNDSEEYSDEEKEYTDEENNEEKPLLSPKLKTPPISFSPEEQPKEDLKDQAKNASLPKEKLQSREQKQTEPTKEDLNQTENAPLLSKEKPQSPKKSKKLIEPESGSENESIIGSVTSNQSSEKSVIQNLKTECRLYREWLEKSMGNQWLELSTGGKKASTKNKDLYLIHTEVKNLENILSSGKSDAEKLQLFSEKFKAEKQTFKKDSSHPALKFGKAVLRFLAIIFSIDYYSDYREKKLGLTRQSSHFWQSSQKLRGKEFIKGVKEQVPDLKNTSSSKNNKKG